MSGAADQQSRLEVRDGFAGAAREQNATTPRKTTTLSIRLTAEERAKLEAAAGGAPLGRHIKDVVLRDGRRGYGMADKQALARVLRALAASNLAVDLEALYRASLAGEIALLDGMTDVLERACDDVAEMRKDLVKALGLRPSEQGTSRRRGK